MWIIELAMSSHPERLSARAEHRDRLADLHGTGVVRMAGPLADDSGAIIVLDLPDKGAVDALIADDPYFSTPGVRLHQIRQWQPFLQ